MENIVDNETVEDDDEYLSYDDFGEQEHWPFVVDHHYQLNTNNWKLGPTVLLEIVFHPT